MISLSVSMISITFSTDNLVDLVLVGVAFAPLDSINSRTKGNVTKKIGGIVFLLGDMR